AVRDVCDSRHQREYTLLLPVATSTVSPPTTAAAPAHPSSTSVVRQASSWTTGDTPATDEWTTVPGESVASLTQALHPRNARARRALAARLFELNPDLARNGLTASAPLPPGTRLRVPGPAALATLP